MVIHRSATELGHHYMEDPCLPMSKQVIPVPPLFPLWVSQSLIISIPSSKILLLVQLPKYSWASQSVQIMPKGAASHLANRLFTSHQALCISKSTQLCLERRDQMFSKAWILLGIPEQTHPLRKVNKFQPGKKSPHFSTADFGSSGIL